jgi:LysR family transcriptional regulator, low CO2-responsive transcriptional regulator
MEKRDFTDTDQLTAFLRIVREGSFSRAAFSLDIGQPAVSARIQALEATVGGSLFVRGRRASLTPLGERFLPFARRTLEVLAEGLENARQANRGQRGRITLATLGSLSEGLIGPALESFLRKHPEVECITRSSDHESVLGFLWDRIVELGVVVWPCADAFSADLLPLVEFDEPVSLVAAQAHPLAGKERVTRADLVKSAKPLLLLRWWENHHPEMVRLAHLAGTHVEIPKEAARHLVLQGLGAGFFPRAYIAEDLKRGAIVEINVRDMPKLRRQSALVSRLPKHALSPAARGMVAEIRKQAERMGLLVKEK